jgi:hypothetical protein
VAGVVCVSVFPMVGRVFFMCSHRTAVNRSLTTFFHGVRSLVVQIGRIYFSFIMVNVVFVFLLYSHFHLPRVTLVTV